MEAGRLMTGWMISQSKDHERRTGNVWYTRRQRAKGDVDCVFNDSSIDWGHRSSWKKRKRGSELSVIFLVLIKLNAVIVGRGALTTQINVVVEDLAEEHGDLHGGDKSREPDRPRLSFKDHHVKEPDPRSRDLDHEHHHRKVSCSLSSFSVMKLPHLKTILEKDLEKEKEKEKGKEKGKRP